MKELLEKLLGFIPAYLRELALLLGGPKRFMSARNTGSDTDLNSSLMFMGITICLVFILQAPLLDKDIDIWIRLGSGLIQTLSAVLIFAFVLRLAWQLVGGRAKFERFFIAYAYYFSAVLLLLVLVSLCADGIIKSLDPSLYEILRSGDQQAIGQSNPLTSSAYLWSLSVLALGLVLTSIWSFIGWGAYREINGLSKARSAGAFLIAGIINWPAIALVFFIGHALR